MFKKNTPKKTKSSANANENTATSTLKSWITGKLGSFLLLSATGYALYKFGIIKKITNYFTKKDKDKTSETATSTH